MFKKITGFFFGKYEESDFVLQQKVKTLFFIILGLLLVIFALLISLKIRGITNLGIIIPPAIGGIVLVAILFLIRIGFYSISAHSVLIISFLALWAALFYDKGHLLQRLDSIVGVISILILTPLVITKRKLGIVAYFVINICVFVVFSLYTQEQLSLSSSVIAEYMVDNIIALTFIGIMSYQLFNINRRALDRAKKIEIEIQAQNESLIISQEALRKSEEKYRLLAENISDVIWVTSLEDLKYTYVSPSVEAMGGYTVEEMMNIGLSDMLTSDSLEIAVEILEEALSKEGSSDVDPNRSMTIELEYYHRDGSTKWIEVTTKFVRDEYGKPTGITGVARDIADRKQAEEALKIQHRLGTTLSGVTDLKEALFMIMNSSLKVGPIDCGGIYLVNFDGGLTLEYSVGLSDSFLKSRISYDKDSDHTLLVMKGKPLYLRYDEVEIEDDSYITEGLKALAIIPVEYQNRVVACMNVVSYTSYEIDDTSRSTLETIASQIGRLIERLRAEDQIKASLREKEVLLLEIHHRVKNNMQIISSLLSLQSRHIRDEKDIQLFKDSQNRVRSMALVHEKLYQSKDLARIDFAEYIESLAIELFRSYQTSPDAIRMDTKVKDISLSIDIAIPCALIINELVSNSLKYAFTEGSEGRIQINLNVNREGGYTLIVSDNGVALPEYLDFRNTETLGLQLVNILTKQLNGSIEFDGSEGAKFTITF